MLPRKEFALLCGHWDQKERYVLMVLGGVGCPLGEEALLQRVKIAGPPLRDSRYRQAIERLRQDGVLVEVEPGLLGIAEPDAWSGRIDEERLAAIDAARGSMSSPGRQSAAKGKPGRPAG